MSTGRRFLLPFLGLVALLGGGVFSLDSPRTTLHNQGLTYDYPWTSGAALLVAASGAALVGWSLQRRVLRLACVAIGLTIALVGLDRLTARLDAEPDRLVVRDLLVRREARWGDVQTVEAGPEVITLVGPGETRLRVATGWLRPDQRAALDRVVARRIATARPAPPATPRVPPPAPVR